MNIYDIAREAGVSISTVSRVLNNKANVTPATRAKIQAVLDKNQYAPSAIARGLVASSMKTVAILAVDLRVPHYAHTTYNIEQEFTTRDYNVMVCNTGGELAQTRRYAAELAQRQIDGVVLVGSVFNTLGKDPEVARALQGMPVVLANGMLNWPNAHAVLVDDELGTRLATRHLIQKGHRHIVYVKDRGTDAARHKQNGFTKEMRAGGLACDDSKQITTPYGLEGGKQAARQILAMNPRPTGIVCAEDLTAVGVLKALALAGVRVPDDMAVTGYNNSEYSLICTPELTSVDNKGDEAAITCARLLEACIEGTVTRQPAIILPELVVRQSS